LTEPLFGTIQNNLQEIMSAATLSTRLVALCSLLLLLLPSELLSQGSPLPTNGLRLHLRADVGVVVEPGNKVSQWSDQSGNGFHATETRDTNWQPTIVNVNGVQAIRFSPVGPTSMILPDHATLGLVNSENEIFIVSRTTSAAVQFPLAGGINYNELHYRTEGGMRYIPRLGLSVDHPATVNTGNFHVFNAIATTTNTQLGIDGVFVTVEGGATHDISRVFNVGTREDGTFRFDGDLAEVIVYNRKLTNAESMQVAEYLKNKYSTSFSAYGAPQTPASGINFTGVSMSSMNMNLSKGSGTHRIVVARKGGAVTATPIGGVNYTASTTFGAGSNLGDGNFVIYDGTEGTSLTIAGLEFNETYHFAVYEYYLVGGQAQFGPASIANQTTIDLTQASSLVISSRTADTFTGSVSAGTGTHRIIVARAGSAVNQGPSNGVTYTGNSTFGAGTQIGSGNFVIYAGTGGNSYSFSGLTGSTVYHLAAYEYMVYEGVPKYQLIGSPVTSGITYPSISASAIQFSSVGLNEMTVSFTPGDGQKRIVIAREGAAVSAAPSDGQTFSANASMGSGQDLGSGNFVVYDGTGSSFTLTNLSHTTTYHFAVYEYNEYNSTINFKTTSPATGAQTTTIVPLPTVSIGAFSNYASTSVTVAGAVNPSGFETSVSAVYGIDPGNLSSSTTPMSIGSGVTDVPVTFDLSGLTPGQVYYVAIRAENLRGEVTSDITSAIPMDRTAMRGWYRADRMTNLTGSTINSLSDISGLNNQVFAGSHNGIVTPATLVQNEINGQAVMRFPSPSGAQYNIATDALGIKDTNLEIFVVFKSAVNNTMYLMSNLGDNNSIPRLSLNESNSGILANFTFTGIPHGSLNAYTNNAAHVVHYKVTDNRTFLRINNEEPAVANFRNPIDRFTLSLGSSGSNRFNGDIAEVIIYNQNISADQRTELANYLSERYNITVFTPLPSVAASNLAFPSIQATSFTVSMDAGNGAERLIVARLSDSPRTPPASGVSYTANTNFGSGSNLGNGNFVVGRGTGTSVTVTGLTIDSEYTIDVYEYNLMEQEPQYLLTSVSSASATTLTVQLPTLDGVVLQSFTGTTASIQSNVNPNSFETTIQLFYGTSLSDLSLTNGSQVVGSQSEVQQVQTNLTELTAGRRYYYRVSATNLAGTVNSEIASFFTDFTVNQPVVSLSSLQYWLAGDGAIDTTESGSRARLWANQAGVNTRLHATQTGLNDRPQVITEDGIRFLRFDGTSDFMELTSAESLGLLNSDYEIFIVARTSNQNIGFLMGGTIPNFELHTRPGGEVGTRFIPKTGLILDNPVNSTDGNFHIFNAKATETQTLIRINGNTTFTNQNGRSGVASSLILGSRRDGSFYFDGDVAEVIFYNSSLTVDQSWEINSYLANKYGISLTNYRAPSVQAGTFTFSNATESSITIAVNPGNGTHRLVVMRNQATASVAPVNGTLYTANTAFGSGNTTGEGNYVVKASSESSVTVTGLTPGATYTVDVYEYNLAGDFASYQITSPSSSNYLNIIRPFPQLDLTLWLSASNGIETGAGSIVTKWNDLSSAGNNAIQTAAGFHPTLVNNAINGEPVIRFNGTSSYLVIDNALNLGMANSDYELFFVATSASAATQFLWSAGIGIQEVHLNGLSGLRFLASTGKIVDAGTNGQFANGQPILVNVRATDESGSIRINNELLGQLNENVRSPVSNQVLLGLRTGGTFFFNGDMAEIIAYNKALSAVQRDSVNAYLGEKYGITFNPITEPTQAATNPVLTQRLPASLQFSLTNGDGSRRLVLAKSGAPVDAVPVDNTVYTANAAFGTGTEIGTGNFVVYAGTGSEFTVTGLSAATNYHFAVFEYNSEFEPDYLTSSNLTFAAKTLNQIPGITASSSLRFSGANEVVTIPHDAAFHADAITMEMWFKPSNAGSVPFLIAKGTEELEIHLVQTNRSIRFIPTTGVYIDSPAGVYPFDEWTHLAVAYKPGESFARMWINGFEVTTVNNGTNPFSHPFRHTTSPISLGLRVNMLPFTGELDEVRIWNSVRTTAEIREYMFAAIPSDFGNLITYFQFNEGTGTTALDAASGLNGTLSNFSFGESNGWRNSGIPFGSGSFNAFDGVTSGTLNASGLDITLTDNFDNPTSVIAKQFTIPPSIELSGNTLNSNNPYWIVETSATPGTYEASLTFTVPGNFVSVGGATTNQFKLYSRPLGSVGNWSLVKSSAASFTSTTVTFDGVSEFGQFVLDQVHSIPLMG
jgi:hypothetical protein